MIMADETNYSSIDAHADGLLALVSLGKSAGSLTFNPDNKVGLHVCTCRQRLLSEHTLFSPFVCLS
jgi:hypothetical protein